MTGTYQWDVSYTGDGNNGGVTDNNAANELVTVSAASPTITTTASQANVTLGTTSVTLNDTALLSGGYNATGSITFTLYQGTTLVDTETVTVTGNGTYTTPTGYTLPTAGGVTGAYQWDVSYGGDGNNNAVSDTNDSSGQVTVTAASPTLVTNPSPTTTTLGPTATTLTDSALLSGGYNETGSITFTLYYNGGETPVDTETVTVSGNGTYTTPAGYTLPTTSVVTGTYQWDASYSGDTNNNAVSDNNDSKEQVTVSTTSPEITFAAGASADAFVSPGSTTFSENIGFTDVTYPPSWTVSIDYGDNSGGRYFHAAEQPNEPDRGPKSPVSVRRFLPRHRDDFRRLRQLHGFFQRPCRHLARRPRHDDELRLKRGRPDDREFDRSLHRHYGLAGCPGKCPGLSGVL